MMRHPVDGRVHFSELKHHAESPAHVRLAVQRARDMSRPMRVGAVADCIVFGNRGWVEYPGPTRQGKVWQQFQEEHRGEIVCIASELDDARGAAEAVLADQIAAPLLDGCEFQRVMQWEAYGLQCAAGIAGERGGFDAIHYGRRYIADLKVTSTVQPEELQRHARKMFWPEQGKWYVDGANAKGIPLDVFKLICVEATEPHCVTVMTLTPKLLDRAGKQLLLWTERHRACEAADAWPGYVQDEVEFDVSEWETD